MLKDELDAMMDNVPSLLEQGIGAAVKAAVETERERWVEFCRDEINRHEKEYQKHGSEKSLVRSLTVYGLLEDMTEERK